MIEPIPAPDEDIRRQAMSTSGVCAVSTTTGARHPDSAEDGGSDGVVNGSCEPSPATPHPAGAEHLWRQFVEGTDQHARDRLVLHYAPLVKYVAGRVGTGLPTHVDVNDLVQSGIFGLVDAIQKFDPGRGQHFETYAMQRIRGAILDDLRAQDWAPRAVRSRAR